jgi:nucleoside-diphosphate-sugar epimerase
VHDAVAVASAIDGTDAVLSTLGVPFAKTPISVYSDGATNIIAGMHAAGIKRLVCVSSSAIGPHPEPLGGFVFEKIMQPYVVNKLGKTLYDDMRRMEAMVSASDLAWTIVRPSGLFEAPAVSEYGVAIDHIGYRFTARIDLADCLLRQALGDTYARSTIAVATPSAKPSMLKLIWQEGIRKKP